MHRVVSLVLLLGVLLSASATLGQTTCGYGGVDVSTTADLVLNNYNGYNWAIRPCGAVSTAGFCNGQFCQGGTNISSWSPSGDYSSTGTDNSPIWAYTSYLGQPGIAQVLQDGTSCGALGARQGFIQFICSASATTPTLSAVFERTGATCHYTAIVYTSAVCALTAANSQQLGSAVISNQCGAGIYNLASLTTSDITYVDSGNWTHYIRLCGAVNSTTACLPSAASVCQAGFGQGNVLSVYQPIDFPTIYQYNGNGLSQIIQDGAQCGGAGEERQSNITLVCNAAATTPTVISFSESPTCHYNYVVQTSAVCGSAFAVVASPAATCGFGPYDLTPLSNQDFLLSQGDNQWAIRPCGNVQTPGYCNGTFCQGSTIVSYYNASGDYTRTNTDNSPVWAYSSYLGMSGVAQIIQDGDDCGGFGARQGTIEFVCNTAATTPYLATVIETVTCHYQAVIMTSLVCGAINAELQTVGSAVISTQCGGGIYDLTPLSGQEINTTETGSNWVNYIYLRLCGTVTSTNLCALNSTSPAQVCQIDPSGGGAPTTLSMYQPYAYPTVWQYNGNGVSQIVQDGVRCGTAEEERLTNITMVCNAAATTAYISSFSESPTCHYNFVVQTSLVCGTPFSPALLPAPSQNCTYGPYNLNSISGTDLLWYGNGNWWAIRPCGTVQTTGFCAGEFCQGTTVVSVYNGSALANYASTGTDNTPIWASVTFGNQSGVAQIIQDGTSCGGNVGSRQGAIYFVCNSSATTPFISTVFEGVICHYTAVIQTSAVCGVTAAQTQVVGGSFISNQCGGTVYNLSSIAANDIIGVVQPTAADNTTYNFYINLCGNVRSTNLCVANNSANASVCQVDTGGFGYGYPLSSWNPAVYPVIYQYNGNGVSQIIQDGFACGNEERLTNITLICSPTATTPVFVSSVESPTCHYTITIQTSAVCGPAFSVAQPAGSCMWGGYDLSPLTGTDIYLTAQGYNWAIRPCGTVSNTSYCGAQFCQGSTIVSYYNPTGDYSSTGANNAPQWAYTSFLGQTGVAQIIQDGAACGTFGDRQGTIEFICNATATTPYWAYVIETVTCHYQAIIYTNLVCGISSAQLQAIGAATVSTQCGGGFYDLGGLTGADITATLGGDNYYIRLCGVVSTTQLCQANSSVAAQVCQVDPNGSSGFGFGYGLSVYQPYAYPTIYQYNGNGLSQIVQDGVACGGEERQTNITLVCSASATSPQLVSVDEPITCHYNIVILTSAVCGTPFAMVAPPVVQSCSFGSVDLSTVATQDLLWYGNGYWWAIRPCGTVQTTGFCAGQFCQATTTVSLYNGTALVNYAGTGTDNTPIWAYVTSNNQQGVAQILQDGTSCGGNVGSRQGVIYFLCNAAATTPYITNVTEAANTPCHYTAIIQTSAVCGVTAAQTQVIGASVVSTQCGGGIYDLTNLAANDITGTVGPTATDSTVYNYYISLCGTVKNTNLCVANNSVNASVCQVDASGFGYGYPLSTYNPTALPVVYTYNGNGLSQIIQDGFACGGEERLTNITLVCNASSTTPYLSSVIESPTCHYTMTVQTNQVCGAAFTGVPVTTPSTGSSNPSISSSTGASPSDSPSASPSASVSSTVSPTGTTSTGAAGGTSSSSSSGGLSGGAIAGIVIGSVVGAALLFAVCMALCLGGRRGRKSAESKELAGGSGAYGEQNDHSHVEHSQTGGYEANQTGEEGAEVEMQ